MAVFQQNKQAVENEVDKIVRYKNSILAFIFDMWGLTPQKAKPEFQLYWLQVQKCSWQQWLELKEKPKANWFGDCVDADQAIWKWYDFQKGKHITWQQTLMLLGVEKSMQYGSNLPRKISVKSGHGIGKSATGAMFILWFLHCFYQSQVPVTAPTSNQMHDVLWKELSIWINKMPPETAELFDWSTEYIRMNYDPQSWFARARTATKENTEAIAGVHADDVAIFADEASGVPEQVFNTAEGALTSGNVFVFLISNPTRLQGYFFDTHNKNAVDWQCFSFNGEESPIVDRKFILLKMKHGKSSDEYKIRVKGLFPGEGMMDDSGYISLIPESRIIMRPLISETAWPTRKVLGVDPSGEGKDIATFVLRDRFKTQCIHKIQTTNPREIAEVILTFIDKYKLDPYDVVVDSFGVGSDVGKEVALASKGKYEIYTVLLGNRPIDELEYNGRFFNRHLDEIGDKQEDLYLNLRALMFFRARTWLLTGGVIVDEDVDNSTFKNEMAVIKYKRSLQGNKIQLMSKTEMLKLGIPSPNIADGFALTLLRDLDEAEQSEEDKARILAEDSEYDPHSVL